jgi:methylenetetrahydrofolate dehydrogenase (NADP+) / methenyltetrahydrofolate cyclohydrolase
LEILGLRQGERAGTSDIWVEKNRQMTARILDGKAIAKQIQAEIADRVSGLVRSGKAAPRLAAVQVGADPASSVYIRNKRLACQRLGIEDDYRALDASTTQEQLLNVIAELNNDERVSGILVQLPLPPANHATRVLDAIAPAKDVDCFHPTNVGLLSQGRARFLPCTPFGVQQILHRSGIDVAGKHVVILGRSEIVGKPLGSLLVQRDGPLGPKSVNATVTIAHSQTAELARLTRSADILVAAIGRARFVTAEMVRPGAVVVDVGINRERDKIVGDVDYGPVLEIASAITPVPGGVGPLTVTILMENTLRAAMLQ